MQQLRTSVFALFLLSSLAFNVQADLQSVFKTITNVGKSVINGALSTLPTPKGLFETSKQIISGYPFEFITNAINSICSTALTSQTIEPRYLPDINIMQFQLITACSRTNFPLLNADKMWSSLDFDPKKKVVILVTGWATDIHDSETVDVFSKAYACRGDVNFVALDAAAFVNTLYTWAAFNTEEIGRHIAVGLQRLTQIVPVENIHLIGHSLGAHIVGMAGRYFTSITGKMIPRITGLDAANPCFNEGERLSSLQRGDAVFVDVIHTNPGVLGKREPIGNVDFYPGGMNALQPGCFTHFCSHARAWQYFAETIYPGNEDLFMAKRCSSLTQLRGDHCTGKAYPMGYATPLTLNGNYFLDVNAFAPLDEEAYNAQFLALMECGECTI